MESYKREFIQFLEMAGVLKFGDFTAKSGRKIPYFINAGEIKTGKEIATLGEFYARAYREKLGQRKAVLYGPAYKGISIAVSAAVALSRDGLDVPFFFNRKEAKDHGEGGFMVGYQPQAGDVIAIVEDVVTAGTAMRESIALFQQVADVSIRALFVSVDRMERGTRDCSTLDELREDYGITVCPIVTVREIIAFLHNREVDGKVYIDHAMKERMEAYLRQYGAE